MAGATEEQTVVTSRSLAALASAMQHAVEEFPGFDFEQYRALITVAGDKLQVYFQPQETAALIEAGASIRGGGGLVYELDPGNKRVLSWHGVR